MIQRSRLRRALTGLGLATVLLGTAGLTAACDEESTSSAQCAYVVGDGQNGRDRTIKDIKYPNQSTGNRDTTVAQYIPCGPRNYIINDGRVKNANDQKVGDRSTVTTVWTKAEDGKPSKQINVWTSSFWTINQSKPALTQFYNLCFKYACYTQDASKAGDANFSTTGWNGMLGETFGGSIDGTATKVVGSKFSSDVTKSDKWDELGMDLSEQFMVNVRSRTGYSNDLFCGSGNSGWKFADHPGEDKVNGQDNTFTCTNVRIVVDKVEATNEQDRNADDQAASNAKRIQNAKELYGDQWTYWLGVQDAIDKCKNNKETTCVINIGDGTVAPPVATKK